MAAKPKGNPVGGFGILIETDTEHLEMVVDELAYRVGPTGLTNFMFAFVEPWLRMRTANRFAQEGDDVVGKWHPLTKATEEIRRSKGYSPAHPINHRQGHMEHFLVNQRGDIKPTGLGVSITYPRAGANGQMEKIKTAQEGKSNPRTPPRPVLGVNENDAAYITSTLTAWIIGEMDQGWA